MLKKATFKPTQINYKSISVVVLLFLFSNALTCCLGVGINKEPNNSTQKSANNQLYLLRLSIPAESRFDASAQNHKGSGAVGLIQFMPTTLREMNLTLYSRPEINYQQNNGLDEDKGGKVTVSDVDRFLLRIYPTAYNTSKTQNWW